MTARSVEVLVVGGGPAGSSTAALLAKRGHEVLVLDRAHFPRDKPCAEYFSPGVVDVLERLGVLDEVLAAGPARPLGMRLQSRRASFLVSYGSRDGPRSGLGLPRSVLDCILLQHARTCGATVEEGATCLGAIVEHDRVVGARVRRAGATEEVRAEFVVGADGLHSAIARSLGLTQVRRWPRRLGLIARYEGVTLGPTGEMHVADGVYCGLAPVGHGQVNVGLVGPLHPMNGESIESLFDRRLRAVPGAAEVLAGGRRVTPIRGMGALSRRVRAPEGPGYVLVGDAAGFLDPFTGEGVYRALRGGELGAEAVHGALERADRMPVGYAAARRAAFADKERVCALVQLFLSQPRVFDIVLRHLSERPDVAALLGGVLGDYEPAAPALRPSYLWSMLRP